MSTQSQWYYSQSGSQIGPVPIGTVRDLVRAGQLSYDDNVWCDGMANWLPVRNVPALMAMLGAGQAAPANPFDQLGAAQPSAPQYGGQQYAAAPNYGGGYSAPAYGTSGYGAQRGESSSGMATAALICTFLVQPVGLILAIVALNAMKKNHNDEGKGMATAALIISIVQFVLCCVIGIIFMIGIGAAAASN